MANQASKKAGQRVADFRCCYCCAHSSHHVLLLPALSGRVGGRTCIDWCVRSDARPALTENTMAVRCWC